MLCLFEYLVIIVCYIGPEKPQWGVATYLRFFLCIEIQYVVQFTSTASGDEVTAAPQKSSNDVIIGASVAGGVLMLVIIAVIIRKCLCKTRTSPAKQSRNIGRVNDYNEGDFELSNMTRKI